MNLNEELKNHIKTQFALFNVGPMLNETRGVFDGINNVIDFFVKLLEKDVIAFFRGKENSFQRIYTSYNYPINAEGAFFKDYVMNITFKRSNGYGYNGGINADSVSKTKTGWVARPYFHLQIKSPDAATAINVLAIAVGHELTHCYNLFQYAIKTNKDTTSLPSKTGYDKITNSRISQSSIDQNVGDFMYLTHRMERNAYIAQLKQELMIMKNNIKDSTTAYNAIKKTNVYVGVKMGEGFVKTINNMTNPEEQMEMINAFNKASGLKFSTFNQLVKYVNQRWAKFKKKFMIMASKIVNDVYLDNPQNYWFDWGKKDKNKF